jgi:hypothetical protein
MTEEDPNLVTRAEKLVAELPLKEPDWETFANRVEKEALLPPATDEALFAAPMLEAEPGEDDAQTSGVATTAAAPEPLPEPASGKAPARESVSLAELARATMAKRGSAESTSIAKQSLDIASQRRAQAEPTPPSPSTRQAITLPPARPRGTDQRGVWIGVGIAAVGLAAGFGLYLTAEREKETIIVARAPAVAPAPQAAVPPGAPASEPARPSPAKGEAPSDAPRGVSLDALEREAASRTSAPPAAAPTPGPTGRLATAAVGGTGGGVKPERVVLEEERTEGAAAAPAGAHPPASAVLKPAELGRNGGSADRPSAGAAQAAVGAVLGAARSCIAGHPRPSSATLVFGSSGEVSQVSVSGEAAGTPAAGCIESALKKARVQPFAAPTFSLAVTVRPP